MGFLKVSKLLLLYLVSYFYVSIYVGNILVVFFLFNVINLLNVKIYLFVSAVIVFYLARRLVVFMTNNKVLLLYKRRFLMLSMLSTIPLMYQHKNYISYFQDMGVAQVIIEKIMSNKPLEKSEYYEYKSLFSSISGDNMLHNRVLNDVLIQQKYSAAVFHDIVSSIETEELVYSQKRKDMEEEFKKSGMPEYIKKSIISSPPGSFPYFDLQEVLEKSESEKEEDIKRNKLIVEKYKNIVKNLKKLNSPVWSE